MPKMYILFAKYSTLSKMIVDNTAGANCDNPNSYSSSVIQIEFPSSTDITKLNEDDIVEIWDTDEGVFSGSITPLVELSMK